MNKELEIVMFIVIFIHAYTRPAQQVSTSLDTFYIQSAMQDSVPGACPLLFTYMIH